MEKFIINPDITMYPGIRVTNETNKTFESETVKQTIKKLKMVTHLKEQGTNYESTSTIKINLTEGDILIYDEKQGYKLPGIKMATIKEVAEDLEAIKEV